MAELNSGAVKSGQAVESPVTAASSSFAARRSTDREIACAIDLGWRLASLYGLRPGELGIEPSSGVLPLSTSLSPSDRLQLELQAAAGDAKRVGAEIPDDTLRRLTELTRQPEANWDALRELIMNEHIALEKALWSDHEAKGKAYELGNFLSDTWNRVVQALRDEPDAAARSVETALAAVFDERRIRRIKILLDDLQSRIDPAAVRIIERHLESWHARVQELRLPDGSRPRVEASATGLEPLQRQTIIWRQLASGDKEPEAYLGREERARVRDVMVKRMAQAFLRHKRTITGIAVGLGAATAAVVYFWDPIRDFYESHSAAAGAITAFIGSVATAFGLSTTSIVATVRKSIDARAELVWNTALAELVCEQTSCVDELLKDPVPARSPNLVHGPLAKLWPPGGTRSHGHSRASPQP